MSTINQFDLVCNAGRGLYVVVLGPIDIPYFEEGTASEFCMKPLNIQDPKEWAETFSGYLCFDLTGKCDYSVIGADNIQKIEPTDMNAYIPFDNGSGQMRLALGLLKLADSWYQTKSSILDKYLKPYSNTK